MKTHFLFIASLMIFPSINAQFMPVVTPSPKAASLGSIAKCPVNYHTGRVNIEIPLLEVEQSGFKLPIKLIYDTSGLLINNRATWVGTNWTLDAGGIITRTVKGEADENGDKRFWKFGKKLDHPQWNDLSYLRNAFEGAQNMVSLEPDEFNFKIPGISGTFYVGNDQKAHVVGRPDIKVEIPDDFSYPGGDSHS